MFIGNESIQDKANVRKPGDLQLLGFSTLSREGLLEFCIRDCLQREDSIGFETFSPSALSSRTREVPRTSLSDLHKGEQGCSRGISNNKIKRTQARESGADAPSCDPDRQTDIFKTETRRILALGRKVNETTTRHVPDLSEVRRAHGLHEAMRSDTPTRRTIGNDIRLFFLSSNSLRSRETRSAWAWTSVFVVLRRRATESLSRTRSILREGARSGIPNGSLHRRKRSHTRRDGSSCAFGAKNGISRRRCVTFLRTKS